MEVSRFWLGVVLGGLMLGCQAGPTGVMQADGLTQTVRYYDGKQWRDVWVNEREVAEFIPRGREGVARSALPAARLVVEGKGVRIWRLDQADAATTLSRSLGPAGQFSPVFHSSPLGGSRLALTGNIVVRFKPEWSEAQIQDWLTAQGLSQIKALSGMPSTYLLSAGNGHDALTRANAIQESGEVVYAMPEWWREVSKR